MELKEFITVAISSIVEGVKSANGISEREIKLASLDTNRTIEFDIAVSVSEKGTGEASGGIKVWGFAEGNIGKTAETSNSTVSRLSFGVEVDPWTKEQNSSELIEEVDHINDVRKNKQINQAR